MEEDAFLAFVEAARRVLLQQSDEPTPSEEEEKEAIVPCEDGPSWGWLCCRILDCLKAYSSGVTPAIVLSELLKAWLEKSRVEKGQRHKETSRYNSPGLVIYKQQKNLRTRLPNIVTIDSIHEKRFISLDAVLEVVILNIQLLSGTSSYLLTLGDAWSTSSIDMYLHRKFYDLVDEQQGVLRKGREIRLTGCRLRTAVVAGSSQTRLLPTEYLVVLLDEEQDEDALLLGARFCSDTFSNIQVNNAVEAGSEYCFYARLENIGQVEVHPQWNHVKQQTLILVDENQASVSLVLWDEQVALAGLFSQGSMIALERPAICQSHSAGSQSDTTCFLEYGSSSCLYTVPFLHQEEQVMVEPSSQKRLETSAARSSEGFNTASSQLMLPRDSQGSIDYSNFPFRLPVSEVRPKMSNISLYGIIRSLATGSAHHQTSVLRVCQSNLGQMTLEDNSGSVTIQLIYTEARRDDTLEVGHTVFITGILFHAGPSNCLMCVWNEKDTKARVVNLTRLPALLTSSCLYQLVPLHVLSRSRLGVQVCKVLIKDIKLDEVRPPPKLECMVCDDCGAAASQKEAAPSILMSLELYDRHCDGDGGKCTALCFGHPALEILQASAEDFLSWPQDEQALYLYSLQTEEYVVAMYDGTGDCLQMRFSELSPWRIGQAMKLEPWLS